MHIQIETPEGESGLELVPEKSEAVETTEEPLLIIAGPGSGKTRTLVERTVRLVQRGIDPLEHLRCDSH